MVRLPPANTRSGREKRAKKYPPISAPGSSRMAACMELAKVTPLQAVGRRMTAKVAVTRPSLQNPSKKTANRAKSFV